MRYAATIFGLLVLLAAVPARAQAPRPGDGVVPPAEVTNMVRSNGLRPLGPPVRQRSIYVLRATNARGVQMSVIVDAHDGRMLAVSPVTPGPNGGRVGAYGPPPVSQRGYATATPGFAPPEGSDEAAPVPPRGVRMPLSAPPLPRPRPANLVAEKGNAAPAPEPPSDAAPAPEPAKDETTSTPDAQKPHGGPLPINN